MIPLIVPNISGREEEYVKECLETGWISTAGSFVDRFENEFASYLKVSEALSVMNGTSALHLAMMMLNIKQNDLVIMPNVTFVASANAIKYLGADPILIDIDEDTWQMDLGILEAFLERDCAANENGEVLHVEKNKRIAAIMIVHVQGNICDMDQLVNICNKYNLPLIEDAAEALGSSFNKKPAGTIGDFGCYSFNGNKIISTGGGGMLIGKDQDLIQRARHISTTAKTDPLNYFHDEVGYNYRLVNILAAIGTAQLEQLENFINAKQSIADYYRDKLKDTGDINFQSIKDNVISNEWLFTITTNKMRELIAHLNAEGIMSRPFWTPMNQLPMYSDCIFVNENNVSKKVHDMALSIPCSTGITSLELERVTKSIINFFN